MDLASTIADPRERSSFVGDLESKLNSARAGLPQDPVEDDAASGEGKSAEKTDNGHLVLGPMSSLKQFFLNQMQPISTELTIPIDSENIDEEPPQEIRRRTGRHRRGCCCQDDRNGGSSDLAIASVYLVMIALSFSISVFVAVLFVLKVCCLTDCLCMEFLGPNDQRC
ncbi:Hypothetical protein NTJ_05574 [Nesidiocoris tenuis]|uniref:Transmembrane protein n=1 Tax=Nesidiocoris tenuis TaxID=355587 RepID=A0ABN7AL31_9HEMI|nr:Hypothetical protein NTJ_05574 [Nesidiocoris tenuis]